MSGHLDLATTYLGLPLSSPILPGASPLVDDLGMVRRLEDAGAPAIVMHSLFEEQIVRERLDELGVDGLVLFNRFYQPDIDVEELTVVPRLQLSDSSELLLRIRWLAVLSGRLQASLSLSGGVHTPHDVVKGIMAGADTVQVV